MTDITGIPKEPVSSGPIPEEPMTWDTSATQIGSVDTMVYEGTDTISPAGLNLLQFAQKIFYEASIQNPELPLPDPDGLSGPQPYGMAEQKLIKQSISKQLIERLKQSSLSPEAQKELYDAILSGKSITNPDLAKLAKGITAEVEDSIRKGAHLPSSWTILSTSPEDWIPQPIEPYDEAKQKEINDSYHGAFDKALKSYAGLQDPPLTPEQIEKIVNAYTTGSVPSDIAEHFEAISKAATVEVQKANGLPNTWYAGTTNLEDWKPVNIGIATPAAINQARTEFIAANIEDQLNAAGQAIQKVLDKLPADDPVQIVGKEYQSVISAAIRELKGILREIQVRDAEKSKEVQKARTEMTTSREKALQEEIKKQQEAREKQEKAEKFSFIMKIIGPIISALATIAGALIAIATLGLGTPLAVGLIIAGVAIGVAMTAYSIADSVTGCTSKLIQAFNEAMKNAFPDNEFLQKLVKFLIVAVIVVVLVIAAVFTGGSAAANAGTQVAAQVAKQAILECIKQLSIQLAVMTIMASNAIPELIGAILKAQGVDKKDSQIVEMIMMIITMIVTMIAVAKGMKASGVASTAETAEAASLGFVASARQLGNQILASGAELIKRLKEGADAAVEVMVQLLTNLIKQLEKLVKGIPAAIQEAYNELLSSARSLLNAINEGRVLENISSALANFKTALAQFGEATKTAAAAALEKAIQSSLELLAKAGGKITDTGRDLKAAFEQIGKGYKGILSLTGVPGQPGLIARLNVLKGLEKAGTITSEELENMKGLEQMISETSLAAGKSLEKTLQLTSGMVEFSDGIVQAVYGFQIYHLLLEIGESKKAQELLQAIIDQLNKLLQNLSSGMDANMEALKGLNQFLNNFMAGQSEMATKMSRALQA